MANALSGLPFPTPQYCTCAPGRHTRLQLFGWTIPLSVPPPQFPPRKILHFRHCVNFGPKYLMAMNALYNFVRQRGEGIERQGKLTRGP